MRKFIFLKSVVAGGLLLLALQAAPVSGQDVLYPQQKFQSPVSPKASLELFQLPEDLKIELVASEPQVVDPVAMRFDEFGRLWVAEMGDYPTPLPDGSTTSRIKILYDHDGDGYYETAHLFADNLSHVTGLQPWKGGVFATISGQVVYMKDTDGDHKVDLQEPWFAGFAETNSQLRANRPRFGLDNSIYIANGLRGGVISSPKIDSEPVSISSRDFRFDPQGRFMEAVSGVGQYGLTFDDFGNRFICTNRNPLRHIVLEDRYLRNTTFPVSATMHDVAVAGEHSRVYALAESWTTSNLHAGQFTAACGVEIYRGELLPNQYWGNSFTCEPTASLIHREILQPAGPTFDAKPAYAEKEFIASPDPWFRPVYLELGPEGALYIVDMYRAVIEHPEFMPDELRARPDLRLGSDLGRIYRVVPAASETSDRELSNQFAQATSDELLAKLESPNAWQRETAARIIYERQDQSLVPGLKQLAAQAESNVVQVQALHALAGLAALNEEVLLTALADSDPRVQEQGVLLAETLVQNNVPLAQAIAQLASKADARLQFQIALSLSQAPAEVRIPALLQVALASGNNPWSRTAITVSAGAEADRLLVALTNEPAFIKQGASADSALLIHDLAQAASGNDESALVTLGVLKQLLDRQATDAEVFSLIDGLGKGLVRRKTTFEKLTASSDAGSTVEQVFARAHALALDSVEGHDAVRIKAIGLLRYAPADWVVKHLPEVFNAPSSDAVQVAAVGALASAGSPQVAELLLSGFQSKTPAVRRAILDGVIGAAPRATLLLEAIASGEIPKAELDPARRDRLVKHPNTAVREKAIEILGLHAAADRMPVIQKYEPYLNGKVDIARGKQLFTKHCSTCHRIDNQGIDVGPDISDSRVKTPEQILTDILAPNRAIDSNYISYSVLTVDGTVHTGLLASETSGAVTLKTADGKSVTLLRDDIDELRSTGVSLMPDGFEAAISPEEMADLVAYIKNWRYTSAP